MCPRLQTETIEERRKMTDFVIRSGGENSVLFEIIALSKIYRLS